MSSSKKRNRNFSAFLITLVLGFFIFVTYYSTQQTQVIESSAATSCSDYGSNRILCDQDPNCEPKPVQGPGVPAGTWACVARPIPVDSGNSTTQGGNSRLSPWQTITGQDVDCVVNGVPTLKCLEAVFSNVIFAASSFIILVLFIMFVVGAFFYLTSGGNPERVKKAQGTLKFAVIGFILFVSAFLILRIIDFLFLGSKGTLFEFNIP